MSPSRRALAAVPLLALLALPAGAAEPTPSASAPDPYAQTFSQLDTNRDGVLTFSETFGNPQISNNFNTIDSNADGVLSFTEVATALNPGPLVLVPRALPVPPVPNPTR